MNQEHPTPTEHPSTRGEFPNFLLTHFPFPTYYENFSGKKFSYCGGGRKPMKVYPFPTYPFPTSYLRIYYVSLVKAALIAEYLHFVLQSLIGTNI